MKKIIVLTNLFWKRNLWRGGSIKSKFCDTCVKAQDNYMFYRINVKAKIDIDSNTPDPFSEEDERFLEWVNEKVAEIMEF